MRPSSNIPAVSASHASGSWAKTAASGRITTVPFPEGTAGVTRGKGNLPIDVLAYGGTPGSICADSKLLKPRKRATKGLAGDL